MVMYVVAFLAGEEESATAAAVEPHDSIGVLLEKLGDGYAEFRMPREFSGAYSLEYTHKAGLSDEHPDYKALQRGDPAIVAKYITQEASLDPTKTVCDYFGDSVEPATASVVLTWSPEAHAFVKEQRERRNREVYAAWERHQARMNAMMPSFAPKRVKTKAREEVATEAWASPCSWLTSWLPVVTMGSRGLAIRDEVCSDAKKND